MNMLKDDQETARKITLAEYKEKSLILLKEGKPLDAVFTFLKDLESDSQYALIVEHMLPILYMYISNNDIEGIGRWINGFR